MGLYPDELRPRPPKEGWTYGPPRALPALSGASAAPRPRQGPPPVFRVARAAGPVTVDGSIEPGEWNGAGPQAAMLLAQDVEGRKAARQSRAWLAYDQEQLYVAVDNTVDPETRLNGNQWGQDDAVEISLRVVREGKATSISVVRGYGNGHLEFGRTPSADTEPARMDPGGILYKARAPEPGRWMAEFSIPLRMLELDPAANARVAFNLTVRKSRDDLWLMWEGTRGHSYDVDRAGLLEFAR